MLLFFKIHWKTLETCIRLGQSRRWNTISNCILMLAISGIFCGGGVFNSQLFGRQS